MSENEEGASAWEDYRVLMKAYEDALKARDPAAADFLQRAGVLWERLRELKYPEPEADSDMHLVVAFSLAVQVGDAAEARRLYECMSEKYRDAADRVESLEGHVKIWLQR
jgi:hypothetical protein